MKIAPDTIRLAVLIDAENAQASIVGNLFTEIAKLGTASVRRIYGDFTNQQLAAWKSVLLEHSIQPVQQYRYTVGKNASDSALIIDAMDLLHSRRFDAFCIVSSDSDFTRLASRIREDGLAVFGFGERKTPKAFVAACDRFIYTEILRPQAQATAKASPQQRAIFDWRREDSLRDALLTAASDASGEDGWASLGKLGQLLQNRLPDFDPRNYGFSKLRVLLEATGQFEVVTRGEGSSRSVVVRYQGDSAAAPASGNGSTPTTTQPAGKPRSRSRRKPAATAPAVTVVENVAPTAPTPEPVEASAASAKAPRRARKTDNPTGGKPTAGKSQPEKRVSKKSTKQKQES